MSADSRSSRKPARFLSLERQKCRELIREAISDEEWIKLFRGLQEIANHPKPTCPRAALDAARLLISYAGHLPDPEQRKPDVQVVRVVETPECMQDCPLRRHPEPTDD